MKYVKQTVFALLWVLTYCPAVHAQEADALQWWNPAQNSFPVIEGQAWGTEVPEPYQRLPARAEKLVRPPVWELSRDAAGLSLGFTTNARHIEVKYTVKGDLNKPHFPTTGVSGIDLYSINADGSWSWAPGRYSFTAESSSKDTITYRFTISGNSAGGGKGREYRLYLPTYNIVEWLTIGVPDDARFDPLPVSKTKPIVIYGTSITQGGCASRAGMAWTSIVGRRLKQPVVNLGFSGNGTLDKEMIDLLTEIDAKIYVLDCLPNLMNKEKFPLDDVQRRILESVRTLHAKRPLVPVVLSEFAGFNDHWLNKDRGVAIADINEILRQAYTTLKASGIKNIYMLTAAEMKTGIDDTVDGTHPNDLGMTHYADAYEKILRSVMRRAGN